MNYLQINPEEKKQAWKKYNPDEIIAHEIYDLWLADDSIYEYLIGFMINDEPEKIKMVRIVPPWKYDVE